MNFIDNINNDNNDEISIYKPIVKFSSHDEALEFLKLAISFLVDNDDNEPIIFNGEAFLNKQEISKFLFCLIDKIKNKYFSKITVNLN
jgi:hypothetical protein